MVWGRHSALKAAAQMLIVADHDMDGKLSVGLHI